MFRYCCYSYIMLIVLVLCPCIFLVLRNNLVLKFIYIYCILDMYNELRLNREHHINLQNAQTVGL